MRRDARVLAVIAHPDDEAWAMGGTLALWARGGVTVRVLCMTRGEAGSDRRGLVQTGAELGALRSAELRASCRQLGAEPVVLDLPDGGLAAFPVEQGVAAVRSELESFDPDIVLTLGPDGGYGNLDHMAVTRWVAQANPRRVLHATFPPGLLHPIWRGLRRARFDGVQKGLRAASFGRAQADLRLDISGVAEQKRAAVAAHASQLVDGDPDTFLRRGLLADLSVEERWTEAS